MKMTESRDEKFEAYQRHVHVHTVVAEIAEIEADAAKLEALEARLVGFQPEIARLEAELDRQEAVTEGLRNQLGLARVTMATVQAELTRRRALLATLNEHCKEVLVDAKSALLPNMN